MSDEPTIGGYEWSFTCACGQTISLSGMMNHPTPDEYTEEFYQSEAVKERIRTIEGMLKLDCPNEDCDRTLKLGIEVED